MARDEENWKGYDGVMKSLEQDPKAKFLDSRGSPRTSSLFYETNNTTAEPMYTLRDYDFEGLPSLKRLYLEERDLTGYIFANKYLHSFANWQKIRKNKRLAQDIDAWEEELEIMLQAEAISAMIKQAQEPGATGLAAAKFISQKGWEKNGKGRPSKKDIEAEAKKAVRLDKTLAEARERIKLKKHE